MKKQTQKLRAEYNKLTDKQKIAQLKKERRHFQKFQKNLINLIKHAKNADPILELLLFRILQYARIMLLNTPIWIGKIDKEILKVQSRIKRGVK